MTGSRLSPYIRPAMLLAMAWACVGIAFLAGVIELVKPGAGVLFGNTVTDTMARVPDAYLRLFEVMFGFYAIGKSGENVVKVHSAAKYEGPKRPPEKEPDE